MTTEVRVPETVAEVVDDRIVGGIILPWDRPGETSAGTFTFRPGRVTWPDDVSRVKLLLEHDKNRPVGYAVLIEERPAGLYAEFLMPPTWESDDALGRVGYKLRDAFSPGIKLTDAARDRARNAPRGSVAGDGRLAEVSLVTVPAWDDTKAVRR